jgi:hypothetical protein
MNKNETSNEAKIMALVTGPRVLLSAFMEKLNDKTITAREVRRVLIANGVKVHGTTEVRGIR